MLSLPIYNFKFNFYRVTKHHYSLHLADITQIKFRYYIVMKQWLFEFSSFIKTFCVFIYLLELRNCYFRKPCACDVRPVTSVKKSNDK